VTASQRWTVAVAGAALLAAASFRLLAAEQPPVIVDYFFEPGCPECEQIKLQVLPRLAAQYEGFYTLRMFDVGVKSNVVLLAAYQQTLGIAENAPVSMIVDYQTPLVGLDQIKRELLPKVEQLIMARLEPGWSPPTPITIAPPADHDATLADRARQFTLPMVVFSGLVDGLNPCAISTLVFFMSVLMVAKIKGRGMLVMGVSFCTASFITYVALGFGLLRALHSLHSFSHVQRTIEIVMMAVLAIFAFLSFRDAWRYHRRGNANQVSLQLPRRVKEHIHTVMRKGVGYRNLALSGFVVGCLVTALESVCTGQVYVPTLVMVLKSNLGHLRSWALLLLYNAMFVAPLVIVFTLAYRGMKMEPLLAWSRRNVVVSKCLLGFFFVAMGCLIFIM
jgi:hypothetical protein